MLGCRHQAHCSPILGGSPLYEHTYMYIAPGIPHQLHQGVIKHLLAWLKSTFDEAEIDAQSWGFPPNHDIYIFMKEVTLLS